MWGCGRKPGSCETIPFRPPYTITHLSGKHNIMLISSRRSRRAHLRAQAFDEIFDMLRQRGAALHRDEGIEGRRLDDAQELDARHAAMGDGELVDDGDAEPC